MSFSLDFRNYRSENVNYNLTVSGLLYFVFLRGEECLIRAVEGMLIKFGDMLIRFKNFSGR